MASKHEAQPASKPEIIGESQNAYLIKAGEGERWVYKSNVTVNEDGSIVIKEGHHG